MDIFVKDISKSFGKKEVLNNVSFNAVGGSCVGIIGANGCGKSTLFSILAGVQYGKGAFFADGVDLMANKKLRSQLVGYIPQGTPLIEELSAYDNLLLWYSEKELKKQLAQADSVINKFGVNEFLRVAVKRMSGGMKKRLSIVCAVAHNPQIIIMDEPTAALDILCKQTIKNYIADCKASGKTVILSTHDADELSLCDEILILKNGGLGRFEFCGNIDRLAECIK